MQTNPVAKRILCFGDSNTRGWVPGKMGAQRFDATHRWPGILQEKLGTEYEIIEEGLGARLVAHDDPRPGFAGKNGLTTLPILLETHLPLDLVIIMLGTPDTKEMMNLSAEQITQGIKEMIQTIKNFRILDNTQTPQILLVVPPVIDETPDFASKLFIGGTEKSKTLITTYAKLAEEENIMYLNPTDNISVDQSEGIHLGEESHAMLAELIYQKII